MRADPSRNALIKITLGCKVSLNWLIFGDVSELVERDLAKSELEKTPALNAWLEAKMSSGLYGSKRELLTEILRSAYFREREDG